MSIRLPISFILFLSLQFIFCQAQISSPYSLNKKLDFIHLGLSASLVVTDVFLSDRLEPLSVSEINSLNKNDINTFDRSAVENWNQKAKVRSDIGLISSASLAAITGVIIPYSQSGSAFYRHFTTLAVMGIELNLITYFSTEAIKNSIKRSRPYMYNPSVAMSEKTDKYGRKSFFSGHSSLSAANTFFIARVFSDYFPDSKFKKWVWSAAILLPAWTAAERYYAGMHFPTDVISGYIFGASLGYLIPHLHKKKEEKNISSFDIFPVTGPGYSGICMKFNF